MKEQQLKQMLTTVPTGVNELGDSGLGIFKMKLSNIFFFFPLTVSVV
ncbi:hypothetical protein bcgnr5369_68550 [Bacillus cereus]